MGPEISVFVVWLRETEGSWGHDTLPSCNHAAAQVLVAADFWARGDGEATSAEVYCFVVVSVIYGWEGEGSTGGLVCWQG